MVDTKQARRVYRVVRNFCGRLFLRIGQSNFFRLGVMKQECSVIVRWRDFTPIKLRG